MGRLALSQASGTNLVEMYADRQSIRDDFFFELDRSPASHTVSPMRYKIPFILAVTAWINAWNRHKFQVSIDVQEGEDTVITERRHKPIPADARD